MRTVAFMLLVVGALGVACDGTTEPESLVGTYTLQTVDGEGPPWWAAGGAYFDPNAGWVEDVMEWTEGSLALHSDGTLRMTLVMKRTIRFLNLGDSTVTTNPVVRSGTYTVTGKSIQLTFDNTMHDGTVSGRRLTLMVDGVPWVFAR
jgi:hypothetical protein